MTMLAMWRDEKSVALATDGKMTEYIKPVQKLHIVQPNRLMFGIGFDGEAFEWLRRSRCSKEEHPYPQHWRDCSEAENTDALERFIKGNLCSYQIEQKLPWSARGAIRIWLAGVNEQGGLEAFVLNDSGSRIHETKSGAHFNETIKCELKSRGDASPEQLFQTLKKAMDGQIEFAGAMALIETSRQLINLCESAGSLLIGGPLQCYIIIRE